MNNHNNIVITDDKFNLITVGKSYGLSLSSKQYQEDVYTMKEPKAIGDFYAKVLEKNDFTLLKQFDGPNGASEYHDKLFYSDKNNLYCSSSIGSFGFESRFQYLLVCTEESKVLDAKRQLEVLLKDNIITPNEIKAGLIISQMLESVDSRRANLAVSYKNQLGSAVRPVFRVNKNSPWQRYLSQDVQSIPACSDINKNVPKDLMITCMNASGNTVVGVDKADYNFEDSEASLKTIF